MNLLTPHQSKALEYHRHISLTANAGSGKTFVLSKRYLEIALTENLPLRNIAAITFTDKAAGELYQKIANEIEEKLRSVGDKLFMEKLEKIRRQLVSANISTIHSFCIDILREYPVEAEIDANFTPIDEIFADELIELSVEEVFKSSLENPDDREKLKYLMRFFSSKFILSRELSLSIKHRRNLLTLSASLYNQPIEEIATHFYKTFLSITEKILVEELPELINAAIKINSAVLSISPNNSTALDIEHILFQLTKEKNIEKILKLLANLRIQILVKAGTVAVKGYLNRDNRNNLEAECIVIEILLNKLKNLEITANHAQIETELAKLGKTFIYFFNKTIKIYNDKKSEGGYLDYEDILLLTQNILQNENVRKSLSEKFKYIMIDEYQDTNELQYQIFLPILDYLKKGNLFVVGDEKQSIYMFRDAELEVFNKTKKEITEKSGLGSILSLPHSFRMAPNLCLFINTLFRRLFSNPNPLFNEVEHSDIICARDNEITGNVEILLAEPGVDENEETAEANLVTERILKLKHVNLQTQTVNWGDIAILCRKRKFFIELEKSLIRKKIPYVIIGGKGFYQRQSIYDIYNYFSFLLDKNNDTALVGILRSPFFSMSDSEIYEVSLEQQSNLWLKLKSYTSKNPKVIRIVGILEENFSLINKVEVSFLLRKIISETGYLSLLSRANSVQEQANISKLINLTINFFSEGFRTLFDYVNFLRESIEELEDESQAVISDDLNSVKVMTIHQAKGLEFPIVFLYRCGGTTQRSGVKAKSILINKEFGIMTKVPLDENYFNDYYSAPIVQLSNYINERKNIAEIKRLFYVAVTRAKDQLFISADAKSVLKCKEDSFISLLSEELNFDFDSKVFKLNSNLKFLTKKDEEYVSYDKACEIEIPIIKKIESFATPDVELKQLSQKNFHLLNSIDDNPFGEIISATKFSIFNQCEMKYHLNYDFGFSNLLSDYYVWLDKQNHSESSAQFEFNQKEEEFLTSSNEEKIRINVSNFAKIKGNLVHRLLSEETAPAELEDKIDLNLKELTDSGELNSAQIDGLKEDINSDLKRYYDSENYNTLKNFVNYKNEFEIYHQHSDYFLYGIIDKLILTDNKINIVDYKTDSVSYDKLPERADQYFTQLKFYSFLAKQLFTKIDEFELRIIFLKHPNQLFSKTVISKDFLVIGEKINTMIRIVRDKKAVKNLNHCKFCIFSINRECIVN